MNDTITNKPLFTKAIIALVIIGCIWLAALAFNELRKGSYIGRDASVINTITVQAEGEVLAKPDIAIFSFSITEEGPTVGEAQKKSTQKTNTAIDLIKKGGVAEKDIKTSSYNINPKYEYYQTAMIYPCTRDYCPPVPVKNPKIVGYEVSQTIEVKIRKIENAGELLSVVGGVGASNVSGLSFSIDDEEKVKNEAREKAIKSAREKAKALANDLDVRLVRITNFTEGTNYPIYYARDMNQAVKNEVTAAGAPQIPAGENQIISNVTITYEIR